MKAIITVGLGFGDEGKGATVDYLARTLNSDLVVRYCGGPQAGHNVQLPDGRRHTFSQFGAGTLAGAKTYLGPRVIISPTRMVPEAEHLRELGIADPFELLMVHPDCLVSTAFHVIMNRLREASRGDERHGSCGAGVGETRNYWLRYGQDAIFAKDLLDTSCLRTKLALLRDRFLLEMQDLPSRERRRTAGSSDVGETISVIRGSMIETRDGLEQNLSAALHKTLPAVEADLLQSAAAELTLTPRLPNCSTALFEGAQGVLLDEWKGFSSVYNLEYCDAEPRARDGLRSEPIGRHCAGNNPHLLHAAWCRTVPHMACQDV